MPNFLNRRLGGRLRVGGFSEPKTLTWNVGGDNTSFRISYGTWRSTELSGSHEITAQGAHRVSYVGIFSGRGTVRIGVDGQTLVDKNNYRDTTRQVDAGPCAEYSIPNARTACRPGYTRESQQQWEWRVSFRYKTRSGGPTLYGTRNLWIAKSSSITASDISPLLYALGYRGIQYTVTSSQRLRSRTRYYCKPSTGCRETRAEIVRGHSSIPISGGFTVTVLRTTPSPVQPQQPSQPQPQQPQVIVQPPTIPQVSQTAYYTQAKYEVITPARYVESGGQIRPEVRYRSVRTLTAPEVSNLIALGYSVQSVPADTPLVESAAYGPSVVAASSHNAPDTVPVITRKEPRARVGIAAKGRAAAQAAPVSANWRDRNRRVVR